MVLVASLDSVSKATQERRGVFALAGSLVITEGTPKSWSMRELVSLILSQGAESDT